MSADGGANHKLIDLYLERRQKLLETFTARTGSRGEAEDLVQEIYLKLLGVDPAQISNGAAFLYALGMNLLVDRYRARQRVRTREQNYHMERAVRAGGEGRVDEPTPEEAVASRLRLEALVKAVEKLPPRCREVFRLHKLQGLSHGDVAKRMNITRRAVEKHMSVALKHLMNHSR